MGVTQQDNQEDAATPRAEVTAESCLERSSEGNSY